MGNRHTSKQRVTICVAIIGLILGILGFGYYGATYSNYTIVRANHATDRLNGKVSAYSDLHDSLSTKRNVALVLGIGGAVVFVSSLFIYPTTKRAANCTSKTTPITQQEQPEELRKYKQLLDDGVITQADFEAKKKQILGL